MIVPEWPENPYNSQEIEIHLLHGWEPCLDEGLNVNEGDESEPAKWRKLLCRRFAGQMLEMRHPIQ
jgi:hypothetical protein